MHTPAHTTSPQRERMLKSAADTAEDVLDKAVHAVKNTTGAIAAGVGDAVSVAAMAMPTPVVNKATRSAAGGEAAAAEAAAAVGDAADRREMRTEYQRAKEELRHEHDFHAGDLSLDSVVATYHPAPVPSFGGPPSPLESPSRTADEQQDVHSAPIPMFGGTPLPGDVVMPAVADNQQRHMDSTLRRQPCKEALSADDNTYRRSPMPTYGGPPTVSDSSRTPRTPDMHPAPVPSYGGTPMPGDVMSIAGMGDKGSATSSSSSGGGGTTGGELMDEEVARNKEQQRDTERHAPLQSTAELPRVDQLTVKLGPDGHTLRHKLHLDHLGRRSPQDPSSAAMAADGDASSTVRAGTDAQAAHATQGAASTAAGVPQQSIASMVERAALPTLKPGAALPHLKHPDPAGQLVHTISALVPHGHHGHKGYGREKAGAHAAGTGVHRAHASHQVATQPERHGMEVMSQRPRSRL